MKLLVIVAAVSMVGLVAGDGAGHHHGHHPHGAEHAAHGDHGAHHEAHHAPHHAPAVHHPPAAHPHHPAPVHHHPPAPLSFFGRMIHRFRSFIHFNRRQSLPGLPTELDRPTVLVALGVFLVVVLIIDLAISGGLQISLSNALGGRAYDELRSNVEDVASQFYNSIDGVELAMDVMQVEERACRFKAICKAEQAIGSNILARLAIHNINSSIAGLNKYAEAIDAGLSGEDCDLKYDQCSQYLF